MQLSVLFFIHLSLHEVLSKTVQSDFISRLVEQSEPRIFFREIIEASGLFPIEINVPDTIAWTYETVSSYFNGESEGEGSSDQNSQVINDEVDMNSQAINNSIPQKIIVKSERKRAEFEDIFDLISFIIS